MANFIGALLGAVAVIYLLSRLVEWVLIKRIVKDPTAVVLISTSSIFVLLLALWLSAQGKPYAQGISSPVAYFLASVLLAFFRARKATSTEEVPPAP